MNLVTESLSKFLIEYCKKPPGVDECSEPEGVGLQDEGTGSMKSQYPFKSESEGREWETEIRVSLVIFTGMYEHHLWRR